MFGPDTSSSLTFDELARLVEGREMIHRIHSFPVDKDAAAEELKPMRELFTRSIFTRCEIKRGETIRQQDLILKKPGTGLPETALGQVVGATAVNHLAEGQILRSEDFTK